jgi:phosphoribosyl-ATP pyrophosphohydrolase/phosphoribosyl-AMP cyclohydrolase
LSSDDLKFLGTLESVIRDRIENPVNGSYTASLIEQGPQRVAQKIGEEGVELALASVAGSRSDLLNESADLLYHLLVLLNSKGVSLADVVRTLETRHR